MFTFNILDFHYIGDSIKIIIKSAGFKKQNYDNQYIHMHLRHHILLTSCASSHCPFKLTFLTRRLP